VALQISLDAPAFPADLMSVASLASVKMVLILRRCLSRLPHADKLIAMGARSSMRPPLWRCGRSPCGDELRVRHSREWRCSAQHSARRAGFLSATSARLTEGTAVEGEATAEVGSPYRTHPGLAHLLGITKVQ
jgi:hypothetical protein